MHLRSLDFVYVARISSCRSSSPVISFWRLYMSRYRLYAPAYIAVPARRSSSQFRSDLVCFQVESTTSNPDFSKYRWLVWIHLRSPLNMHGDIKDHFPTPVAPGVVWAPPPSFHWTMSRNTRVCYRAGNCFTVTSGDRNVRPLVWDSRRTGRRHVHLESSSGIWSA